MDDAIAQPYVGGGARGKAIPRGKADIRLNGQIYAEGKEKQPEGRFKNLFYHLYRLVLHGFSPVVWVCPPFAGLFFCKMWCCAFLGGLVDLDAADAAFHDHLSEKGVIHKGTFQHL